jgi:predicted AlkP superfamily pyrophosphatase or phosphodiesterase
MADCVVLLSIPGLRDSDLAHMPRLAALTASGDKAPLVPSFPAVTWPVQANMLTGQTAHEHGVVANGFYWRDKSEVEMWTAWNEKIQQPQIWDILHRHDPAITSAAWFPMLSKGSGADYVCMPAPIHNPDGSESLWCFTKPQMFYGELRDTLGHFPLMHFWGPLANIKSSDWIGLSAEHTAAKFKPRFFYVYLPHLDYAAQKLGPDSPTAMKALEELDGVIGRMVDSMTKSYASQNLLWLVASEYVITPVDHVTYPNRILRDAGLLSLSDVDGREQLEFAGSAAWALVDHQFSHVFVKDKAKIEEVSALFRGREGFAEVLAGQERGKYEMDHERSGEIILISTPNSWQAYYWWLEDAKAPKYARTVDIHQKPGYDPVELHFDFATKSVPLDATLIKGSHGAPAHQEWQRGVLLSSQKGVFVEAPTADTDVCDIILRQFGI